MSKAVLCAFFSGLLFFIVGCGQNESDLAKQAEQKLNSVKKADSLVENKTGWKNNEKCFYSWQFCAKKTDEIYLVFAALHDFASFLACKVIKSENETLIQTTELCGLKMLHKYNGTTETVTVTVSDGDKQLCTYSVQNEKCDIKTAVSIEKLIVLLEERGLKLKVSLYAEDKQYKAALIVLTPYQR